MVHSSRITTGLVLTFLTAFLGGCAQTSADLYADYLNRLSNVLNAPKSAWQPPPPALAPSRRILSVTVPDLRVTPLAYWNLRHCALFNLVSERNSILGRVAPPNAVWFYEARVLQGIEQCLKHPATDEEQQGQLRSWQAQKMATWPAATWNGTVAAPAVRHLWQASGTGWAPDKVPSVVTLSNDLTTLASWARQWAESTDEQSFPVTRDDFNAVYQRLGQHNTGGQWRRSVQISTSGLQAANGQLQSAIAANQLCPSGNRTRAADHAQNVLMLVFIGQVQPYLAALNRRGETLLADTASLAEATGLAHPEWQRFLQQLQSELTTLQATSRQHAEYWQALLEHCGITPGGRS